MLSAGKNELVVYERSDGKCPFGYWLSHLKDNRARDIIRVRLDRLAYGNAGKYERLGDDLYELKIYFGPGYRVYFGEASRNLIVLLCGGDKNSQSEDIETASQYWANHKKEKQ